MLWVGKANNVRHFVSGTAWDRLWSTVVKQSTGVQCHAHNSFCHWCLCSRDIMDTFQDLVFFPFFFFVYLSRLGKNLHTNSLKLGAFQLCIMPSLVEIVLFIDFYDLVTRDGNSFHVEFELCNHSWSSCFRGVPRAATLPLPVLLEDSASWR